MAIPFKYGLGVFVKDKVTGFKGLINARSQHLTGCNRYSVQPLVGEDGKMPEGYWLDEHSLEVDPDHQQIKLYEDREQPPG